MNGFTDGERGSGAVTREKGDKAVFDSRNPVPG